MTKTALMFAGQGAQTVGMGRDLANAFPLAQSLFSQANELLGYDLASLCFHGPDAQLTQTEHAQPAIYLVGWIALQVLKQQHPALEFHAAAGLSLGEFTALAGANALGFEDGLRLVRARGRFMQEACETTEGSMAAIIGLDEDPTREICARTGVHLANLNCPGQLVISGEASRVTQACALAKQAGAKRALSLPVAGAYHSPLMKSAQTKLQIELDATPLQHPSVPVISNVTAQPHGSPADTQRLLLEQVTAPVRWEAGIRYLLAQGFARFIELGPGKALSGFLKRIDPEAQCLHVADVSSLEATLQVLRS
jgi:[acyl-carrier-protein] S-malonyltransferase